MAATAVAGWRASNGAGGPLFIASGNGKDASPGGPVLRRAGEILLCRCCS
jgi:hypothetical protein